MDITVPIPEAYVIHKIVINEQRGEKSEKDQLAIEHLMPYLDKNKIAEVINALSKKDKKIAQDYLK